MIPEFHSLIVIEKRLETRDAVALTFAVPDALAEKYRFTQGQFVTLRRLMAGEDVRRSYSLCSAPDEGQLTVGIKRVAGGVFSQYAFDQLRAGDEIEVMTPDGRFFTPLDSAQRKHYVAFAAGSGITPVLSLIKTTLRSERHSRYTLIYGNRDHDAVMFGESLWRLKDQYLDRLSLHFLFSREPQEIDLYQGRIDLQKCRDLLASLLPASGIDEAFICGPYDMIDAVTQALREAGVDVGHIYAERFGTPVARKICVEATQAEKQSDGTTAEIAIVLNGKERRLKLGFHAEPILDALLHLTHDAPFSCKAGVCCTCRARVLEGEVAMDKNYTLQEDEIAQGYVLTCQSHPRSANVRLSYDER